MATAVLMCTDLSWAADGTRHYALNDGTHLLVEASTSSVPSGAEPMVQELLTVLGTDLMSTKQVVRPTIIFTANEEGLPLSMTPLHTFPPGTSHEDALIQAGYEIGE